MKRVYLDLMFLNDDNKLLTGATEPHNLYRAEKTCAYYSLLEFIRDVEVFFAEDLEKDSDLGKQIKDYLNREV